MLKKERQKQILHIINNENKVITAELSELFNVSEDTIRRDLNDLEKYGLLERVHSGAIRKGPSVTRFEQRKEIRIHEKDKITSKALQLITENTVILVDGSTTNLRLIEKLPPDFKATFLTNSPYIAIQLSRMSNVEIITLGGILGKRSAVSLGIETFIALSSFQVDTYLMGIYNIDIDVGITFHSQLESQIKRKMIEVSNKVIAMATSDKLGQKSNFVSADVNSIDFLVTDSKNTHLLNKFKQKKISVITTDD